MQQNEGSIHNVSCGSCTIETLTDNVYRIVSADKAFCNITGYSRDMLCNGSFSYSSLVKSGDEGGLNAVIDEHIMSKTPFVIEHDLITADKETRRVICFGTVTDESLSIMTLAVAVAPTLAAPESGNDRPKLLNYRTIVHEVNRFLKNEPTNAEHTLMIVDMNNYIRLADKLGDVFMNAAMEYISDAITKYLSVYDIIISRASEDVFVILLKNIGVKQAVALTSHINDIFLSTYTGAGTNKINTGCKIGISVFSKETNTYEKLLHHADLALFDAKRQHGLYTVYSERLDNLYDDFLPSVFHDYSHSHHNYDNSFISFAINLMAHSRDIDSSINLLIDNIGRSYDIDNILISETYADDSIMHQSNVWTKDEGIHTSGFINSKYTDWDGFISGFDVDGFMCISNTQEDSFSEADREFFRQHNVYSAVNCLLYDGIQMIGYVSFCCNHVKEWDTIEQDTLYEVSKLISIFVIMRRQKMREARHDSYGATDNITGLISYTQFLEEAKSEINSGEDVVYAVAYSDLNNFAYVNENFGYYAGNIILSAFADKLRTHSPLLLCRVHADRFVALMKFEKDFDILKNIEQSNEEFNKQLNTMYPMGDLRVSTGVCYIMGQSLSVEDAIENANIARKASKDDRSSNCMIFSDAFKKSRDRERKIITGVHAAMQNGGICVFLQPKTTISTRQVVGAEALARWINPDGSFIYPDQFIPPLERVGYIVDLDFFIYEQTLKFMNQWKKHNKKMYPISFNFSRVHTIHNNFVSRIIELADKYNIDHYYVEVEITESAIESDSSKMFRALEALKAAGFKIDIDDFGTGYSSLNMLMKLPVDIVKIDKSFINSTTTEADKNYVNRIGQLILATGKDIIFEGVETEEQAKFLTDHGYDRMQGYLFSKPIPIGDFEAKYVMQ